MALSVRRPLLVLGLLLSLLLGGPGFLGGCLAQKKSFSCHRHMSLNTGAQPVKVDCLQNYYTHSVGCTTLTVTNTNTSTTTFFLKDCQEAVEKDLECFKTEGAKKGFDFSLGGNCVTGKYSDFEEVRAQCNIGPKAALPPDPPHEHETFLLCNCNDEHGCNKQSPACKCDPAYSLCGKNPCSAALPSYQCACEGIPDSPDTPDGIKCVDGKRFCDKALSSKETCFSYAAQDGDELKVYKDCLSFDEHRLVSTCVLKQFNWKDKCASGSAGEYNHALEGCTQKKPAEAGKVQGIPGLGDKIPVTVCPCEGNLCNAGAITVSTSKQSRKNKNGGGRIGGQGIGALGAVAMMMAMLKECNWK